MGKIPINRKQALELLKSMYQEDADMLHYIETEAVMKALAEKFNEDTDYWGMLGLLHDIDWTFTKNNQQEHCIKAVEILQKAGFAPEEIEIIQSHGYGCKEIPALQEKKRSKKIEFALASAETVTGLIYAYALMRNRTISGMEVSGLRKKFKDKKFAAGCSREVIAEIENTGLTLEEFFQISIDALTKIKHALGLQ